MEFVRKHARAAFGGVSLIALVAAGIAHGARGDSGGTFGVVEPDAAESEASTDHNAITRASFLARFPKTDPDAIDCAGFGPLCQVIAGKTVFYVDPEARHAFIGRLYDLEAKRDLTEATLKQIAPDEMARAAREPASEAIGRTSVSTWNDLPFESAIVRNEGGAMKVAVFSDLNCGYCRNFSTALAGATDIEAHEFLIGMAGSEAASRAIGCADNPEAAIDAYYRDRSIPAITCDRDIVEPARNAARALGPEMQGTPSFVRPDGAVTSGFRSIEDLRAWLADGGSNALVASQVQGGDN